MIGKVCVISVQVLCDQEGCNICAGIIVIREGVCNICAGIM